uniref:AlNc14C79G5217 protein n=1 Tax=Albugo laibachii Nc14 TaxID=890382 RepID=F0WF23_9STRA|nr:AlNc14C79G5217 [Albugo laibachii Nc14]|eukprot:CCA19805.1 AlNc14C79G5217 [Albugo laibachii Nc14]
MLTSVRVVWAQKIPFMEEAEFGHYPVMIYSRNMLSDVVLNGLQYINLLATS